jgi:hypothetical protein
MHQAGQGTASESERKPYEYDSSRQRGAGVVAGATASHDQPKSMPAVPSSYMRTLNILQHTCVYGPSRSW